MDSLRVLAAVGLLLCVATPAAVAAQTQPPAQAAASPLVPARVEIQPQAGDVEIAGRLSDILEATGWFDDPRVEVVDGVVFLSGRTAREEWRTWAEALAANTESVVAVVNRVESQPRQAVDFAPAWAEVDALRRDALQALPVAVVVLLVLLTTLGLTLLTVRIGRHLLRPRMPSQMLTNVVVWTLAAPIVLTGIYLALRIAGLTQLALTVLGGTGIAGLIIGIAFRDIAENYLASILLSVRNPFQSGDRIEVAGFVGIVERITTRGTILMTLDGNHLQIPNSLVYKSTITNYTANPKRRMDFNVGIGYDAAIIEAQAALDAVLRQHPVVLDDPEPMVLVERLGASTVDLRAYFWFNGTQYEGLKLKSALIRLGKRALEARHISMPDEAREVIFPQGVPIISTAAPDGTAPPSLNQPATVAAASPVPEESDLLSTDSEGGLLSEDAQIKAQAHAARLPEGGEDLLGQRPTTASHVDRVHDS